MALKTLADSAAKQEVLARLSKVTPESRRQWGSMTPNQMICHLTDSFKGVIGDKAIGRKDNLFSRTLMKWVALKVPIQWPHGVKTMPETDQAIGGTPPIGFEKDRTELQEMVNRITRPERDFQWKTHPMFAEMSEWEWQRWGYLHMDHHLRQFGV